jgi:hypothetical protein
MLVVNQTMFWKADLQKGRHGGLLSLSLIHANQITRRRVRTGVVLDLADRRHAAVRFAQRIIRDFGHE